MDRLRCVLVAAMLAVAVCVIAAGPAVAAKGGNATAQACQKGGWTLGTFANQGDCVNDGAQATTVTFNWTGEAQTWTVPDGVTKATFDLYGDEGGLAERKSSGGKGGRATATIPVTGGSSVQVTVGGQGQSDANPADGGFNGGGNGQLGGGGGGASDIRIGGTDLANRVLVAGGGGGGGNCGVTRGGSQTDGGDGGGTSGDDAFTSRLCAEEGIVGGGGGTQDAGGTATSPATPGLPGLGGNSGGVSGGGGGGGGWFGGGGGFDGGAGGGGSGHGPQGTAFETGVRKGNGLITVTYTTSDS
jgi:hypothetical protein